MVPLFLFMGMHFLFALISLVDYVEKTLFSSALHLVERAVGAEHPVKASFIVVRSSLSAYAVS